MANTTMSGTDSDNTLFGATGDDRIVVGSELDSVESGTDSDVIFVDGGSDENSGLETVQNENSWGDRYIQGWINVASDGKIESWGDARNGTYIELHSTADGIYDHVQTKLNIDFGQSYTITFDATQRSGQESFEVTYNGDVVATVTPSSVMDFEGYAVEVRGTSGTDTFGFRKIASQKNSDGPLIDNVQVEIAKYDNDSISGGARSDTIFGQVADDTIYGGTNNDGTYGTGAFGENLGFETTQPENSWRDRYIQGWINAASAGKIESWGDGGPLETKLHASDNGTYIELDYEADTILDHVQTQLELEDGQEYTITFDATQRSGQESIEVTYNDSVVATITPSTVMDFESYTVTVTGTSGLDTFGFRELASQNNGQGPLIDNVQVALTTSDRSQIVDTTSGEEATDGVDGQEGEDTNSGGTGGDTISDGSGDESAGDEAGNDLSEGETGDETFDGGDANRSTPDHEGDDIAEGQTGNDTLTDESGDDSVESESGNDLAENETGDHTQGAGGCSNGNTEQEGDTNVDGGLGNATLDGGVMLDQLEGLDELVDEWGADILRGGLGADTFVFADDTMTDVVSGFDLKHDAIGLEGHNSANFTFFETDDGHLGIESSLGSKMILHNVDLTDADQVKFHTLGTESADALNGHDGEDRIYGYGGNDTIDSEGGRDRIWTGEGADTVVFGTGYDTNVVYDFNLAEDKISLVDLSASDLQVSAYRCGDLELRTSSGDRLVLRDIGLDDFDSLQIEDAQPALGLVAGTIANDVLRGTGQDELIRGLAGTDRLWGGGGNDVFDFAEDFGLNVVYDFELDDDRILIDGGSFDELTLKAYKESDTEVRLDTGDRLILRNVDHAMLDVDDFIFEMPEEFAWA